MNFEDLINKYINKARMSKSDIELPFNDNGYSSLWYKWVFETYKESRDMLLAYWVYALYGVE